MDTHDTSIHELYSQPAKIVQIIPAEPGLTVTMFPGMPGSPIEPVVAWGLDEQGITHPLVYLAETQRAEPLTSGQGMWRLDATQSHEEPREIAEALDSIADSLEKLTEAAR